MSTFGAREACSFIFKDNQTNQNTGMWSYVSFHMSQVVVELSVIFTGRLNSQPGVAERTSCHRNTEYLG